VNLWLLLEMVVAMEPDRSAVTSQGRSKSYAQLAKVAQRRAGWLRKVAPGRPVLYVGANRLEYVEWLFGAAAAESPIVPVNYRVKRSEFEHFVRTARPGAVVADARYEGLLTEIVRDLGLAVPVVTPDAELDSDPYRPGWVEPASTAVCLFTSGTTSAPKLVRLTHDNLASYVVQTVPAGSAAPEEAALLSAPAYHVAAVSNILTTLYRGRRLVLLPQFDARTWLEVANGEKITHAMVVPTMLARVLDVLDAQPEWSPSSLEAIAYGGAKAPTPLIERALRVWPTVDFVNAFGLTETSSTVALLGPADHREAIASDDPAVRNRLSSAGRPVPGVEIKIMTSDAENAPPGETGVICIRGPQVSRGYVGGKSTVDAEGWLHTGDLGYFDDGGYLFIVDREDDLIIRGGENISPGEIEAVLRRFPGVADAAVVGLPDEEWGQVIHAAVEGDAGVVEEDMRAWVRRALAGYKVPVGIRHVDELPRNDLGKVVKARVRELLSR
jgi:acyl-CoA synthetase (AMP-forming)/AMP-acid ligase II